MWGGIELYGQKGRKGREGGREEIAKGTRKLKLA